MRAGRCTGRERRREHRLDRGRRAGEHLLYVIRGSGRADVKDESLELAAEGILWLDPGERATLSASSDSLEILTAHAPA